MSTDNRTVESDATGVKDDGPNVYGSGLHAQNDTTHLAKMPPDELIRELLHRVTGLSQYFGPNMDINGLTELSQQVNRVQREITGCVEFARALSMESVEGRDFWECVRSLAGQIHETDSGSYRAKSILRRLDAMGLGR